MSCVIRTWEKRHAGSTSWIGALGAIVAMLVSKDTLVQADEPSSYTQVDVVRVVGPFPLRLSQVQSPALRLSTGG